jgi:hypothetical protein
MAGTAKSGPMAFLSTGQGAPGASGWTPTITYLIVLMIAEMVIFGFISRMLR